jgi:hypothetical protein
MNVVDIVSKYLEYEGISEIAGNKSLIKWTEREPKAKFNNEKHIPHGTRVRMIKLSLSDSPFVSLECSLHCAAVQFATRGLFPSICSTLTPPPYTKGQVWPSDPPPNSPLIMLFRSH